MNKTRLYKQLRSFDDAVVTTISNEEIAVCFSFNNVPYIKKRNNTFVKPTRGNILVWSWTDDKLISLDPRTVKQVTSVQSILRNTSEYE